MRVQATSKSLRYGLTHTRPAISPSYQASYRCRTALTNRPTQLSWVQQRSITADERPLPVAEPGTKGPSEDSLGHVSEEAAEEARITGEQGPDLEHGTPVSEVLQRDPDAQKYAPQAIKDDLKKHGGSDGRRSYSTSARLRAEEAALQPAQSLKVNSYSEGEGHIFELPQLPLPADARLKHRYEPIVDQLTKLLMEHGKLSQAQKLTSTILERLRTAPQPVLDPEGRLVPGAPPASHLPLNPVTYLSLAIDSVAPLLRLRSQKGAAGGGMSLQIPTPMNIRQRRRQAILWIVDATANKLNSGGGKQMFARKFADELIAIVEGRSSVWEKRHSVHRLGVNARSNMSWKPSRNFR